MKHVWKGHGADSEIGNVSARQATLNRWTAQSLDICSIKQFKKCAAKCTVEQDSKAKALTAAQKLN